VGESKGVEKGENGDAGGSFSRMNSGEKKHR
jgi:hypothetical protein